MTSWMVLSSNLLDFYDHLFYRINLRTSVSHLLWSFHFLLKPLKPTHQSTIFCLLRHEDRHLCKRTSCTTAGEKSPSFIGFSTMVSEHFCPVQLLREVVHTLRKSSFQTLSICLGANLSKNYCPMSSEYPRSCFLSSGRL